MGSEDKQDNRMLVKIVKEAGYEEAMLGLSLSRNQPPENMPKVACNLAGKGNGHDKFLESIYVWLDVTSPIFWWSEADTYRISTKQSASTMYLITKRLLVQEDFEYPLEQHTLDGLNSNITKYREEESKEEKDILFMSIKNLLPGGFLQRRIWVVNYKTIYGILQQRKFHRLPQWRQFCTYLRENLEHKEFVERLFKE
jgi:hypothetical protein